MLRTISIFSPRGIPGLLFPSLAENKQYCQTWQTECPGRPVHQWVHEGYTCGVSGRVLMTHPQAWCSESSRERRVSRVDLGNLRESGQGEGMVSTGFWKFALRIRNSNFYYADKSNFPGISRKLRIMIIIRASFSSLVTCYICLFFHQASCICPFLSMTTTQIQAPTPSCPNLTLSFHSALSYPSSSSEVKSSKNSPSCMWNCSRILNQSIRNIRFKSN